MQARANGTWRDLLGYSISLSRYSRRGRNGLSVGIVTFGVEYVGDVGVYQAQACCGGASTRRYGSKICGAKSFRGKAIQPNGGCGTRAEISLRLPTPLLLPGSARHM